jgi:hypothetical protein
MKVCTRSSVHPADDIGIVEKAAHGRSGPGDYAMPRRIFAKLKTDLCEVCSQRADA